ncbi:hypothetical protein LTR84_009453 [Exophiala bonariae]|uniref:C3H1-type domain-containing protein n=1 Tax=Exophiala bonariae TaxID=1690606 RepID=A0AAV9MWN9_9EURO|nr:hypothetical protein LTR84_009453 [Exophiala bonariae]
MSNQPFTFPPPPPPPPRRTADVNPQQSNAYYNGRSSYRGGGGSNRGHNRGGRGGAFSDHQPTFQRQEQSGSTARPYGNHAPRGNSQMGHAPRGSPYMNPPQKRNHTAAFMQQNKPRSRPTAPPPVPSFNASIAHLLPVKPPATPTPATNPSGPYATKQPNPSAQPKKNLLGLTPAHPDDLSSSEDDEDEEARLIGTLNTMSTCTATPGLSFSYKGQLSSLKTAEEIKAWIAERRQRFPTAAKADAAKKEREEKKRKWEEEKAERWKKMENQRAERKLRYEEEKSARELARQMSAVEKVIQSQNKAKETESKVTPTSKAEALAEKLRKRALKAENALKKAEEALRIAREKALKSEGGDLPADSTIEAASSVMIDPDETSSSGSSDSDSDASGSTSSSDDGTDSDSDASAAPETISTKDPSLANLPPLPSAQRAQTAKKLRPCGNFMRFKRCRYGSGCRYSHDLKGQAGQEGDGMQGSSKDQKGKKSAAPDARSGTARRKGLYQVMVQKEEEEARRKVVMAILRLGEQGLLDDPSLAGT